MNILNNQKPSMSYGALDSCTILSAYKECAWKYCRRE